VTIHVYSSNTFTKNYAYSGGIFYVLNIYVLKVSSATMTLNSGYNGMIMYSMATDAMYSFEQVVIKSYSKYSYSIVTSYLSDSAYNSTTTLYFSGVNTSINCYGNTYSNNYMN
jgi:hypothetical protein